MVKTELCDLSKSFLLEFHRVIETRKDAIRNIVQSKLGNFPEAIDIEYITFTCIADIERILVAQFNAQPNEHFNQKEQQRKLTLFKKDHRYVEKYTLEAVKSFCRKKQDYWTHGRNKADIKKGEKHKEKK